MAQTYRTETSEQHKRVKVVSRSFSSSVVTEKKILRLFRPGGSHEGKTNILGIYGVKAMGGQDSLSCLPVVPDFKPEFAGPALVFWSGSSIDETWGQRSSKQTAFSCRKRIKLLQLLAKYSD